MFLEKPLCTFEKNSCLFKLLEELTISVVVFDLISCTFIWFQNIINLFRFFMENSICIMYLVGETETDTSTILTIFSSWIFYGHILFKCGNFSYISVFNCNRESELQQFLYHQPVNIFSILCNYWIKKILVLGKFSMFGWLAVLLMGPDSRIYRSSFWSVLKCLLRSPWANCSKTKFMWILPLQQPLQ